MQFFCQLSGFENTEKDGRNAARFGVVPAKHCVQSLFRLHKGNFEQIGFDESERVGFAGDDFPASDNVAVIQSVAFQSIETADEISAEIKHVKKYNFV